MAYGEVLSRAWQIVWRHKVLWIFGLLAGCSYSGGGGDLVTSIISRSPALPFQSDQAESLVKSLAWGVLIAGVVALLLVAISTLGVIGLIRGTVQSDEGWVRKISFGELFNGSRPYFWRVFLLELLVRIVGLALFYFSTLTLGLDWTYLLPLICVLVLVFLAAGVVLTQSTSAIVGEDLGVRAGLKRGWEVAKANIGTMILMWLILVLGITIIGGIIIDLPSIFIPLQEDTIAVSGSAVCCACAYLPFLIVLTGILRSYVFSAWTLTFLRLTAPAAPLEQEALQP